MSDLTGLSCKVADTVSRPMIQASFIVLCIVWLMVGYGVDTLTLALSIIAITLTQMVLASQRRDTMALHAKLDELIHATDTARDDLMKAEKKTEAEIEALRSE